MKEEIIKKLVKEITDYGYNDEYGYYNDWADGARPIIKKSVDILIEQVKKDMLEAINKIEFSDEELRDGQYVIESIKDLLDRLDL